MVAADTSRNRAVFEAEGWNNNLGEGDPTLLGFGSLGQAGEWRLIEKLIREADPNRDSRGRYLMTWRHLPAYAGIPEGFQTRRDANPFYAPPSGK